MKKIPCAYCGKLVVKPDREHVFPKCLYPPSKGKSKIQRLTVSACRDCNNSWADDEAHFRNMIVLAGDPPNSARQELWETAVLNSFKESDGARRKNDIISKMKPVKVANSERYMIFPGEDEKVIRVIRKIIRGLCHYHNVMSPVSEQRVWADVLKHEVPQGLLEKMIYQHREQDIVEYRYELSNEKNINSAWLITFFQKISFIGVVFVSENGFAEK
jgi:hypothetical protein